MPMERLRRLIQRSCSLPPFQPDRRALQSAWIASSLVFSDSDAFYKSSRKFHSSQALSKPSKDYYAILGVPRSAKQADIKKAYYTLAKKYHPDVSREKSQTQTRFQEVLEAYEILGDESRRQKYDMDNGRSCGGDRSYKNDPRPKQKASTSSPRRNPRHHDQWDNRGYEYIWRYEFKYNDDPKSRASGSGHRRFNKTFDFFGMMNNAFSMLRDNPFVEEIDKIAGDVVLTFEESVSGVEKEISFKMSEPCKSCGGQGRTAFGSEKCTTCGGTGNFSKIHNVSAPCFVCFGTGYLPSSKACIQCRGSGNSVKKRTTKIKIPAGVMHNQRLEVKGPDAQVLSIRILIKNSRTFRNSSSGYDIHTETFVTQEEAINGTSRYINTIEGMKEITIPPGTWSGRLIELRGQGLPRPDCDKRGSLIVHVRIQG